MLTWEALVGIQEDALREAEQAIEAGGAVKGRTVLFTEPSLLGTAMGAAALTMPLDQAMGVVLPVPFPDEDLARTLADTEPDREAGAFLREAVEAAEGVGAWSEMIDGLAEVTGTDRAGLNAEALHRLAERVPSFAVLSVLPVRAKGQGDDLGAPGAAVNLEVHGRNRAVYLLRGGDGVTRFTADSERGEVTSGRFSGLLRPLTACLDAADLN